jgi:hypothetical protein
MAYRTLIIIGPGPRWDRVNAAANPGASSDGPLSQPIADDGTTPAPSQLKTVTQSEFDQMQEAQGGARYNPQSDNYGASSVESVNPTLSR